MTTDPADEAGLSAPGADPPPGGPRRILILTYEYPPLGGGTGKAAMNTARALVAMGYRVTVATSGFKGLPSEQNDRGVSILRIPVLRRRLNYANAIEVLSFAASGLRWIDRLADRSRPDLCLAYHTIPCGVVAARLASRRATPYLTLLRGQDVPGYPETPRWMHRLAWPVTRRVWRRSHRVIANSRGLADLAHGSAPDLRIEVAHNGVDLDLYRPRLPAEGRKGEPARVLYLGRLIRKKRIRELIQAWALMLERSPGAARLEVAGFGPERKALESLVRRLGVVSSVRFLGRLDETAVLEALRSADILVNLAEGEGLPNSVLEAMACGLAPLLSDIGPHRELLGEDPCGLLCDGAAPESIAEGLAALVMDPGRRRGLGAAARRRVEADFGWDRATRRLVAFFPGGGGDTP